MLQFSINIYANTFSNNLPHTWSSPNSPSGSFSGANSFTYPFIIPAFKQQLTFVGFSTPSDFSKSCTAFFVLGTVGLGFLACLDVAPFLAAAFLARFSTWWVVSSIVFLGLFGWSTWASETTGVAIFSELFCANTCLEVTVWFVPLPTVAKLPSFIPRHAKRWREYLAGKRCQSALPTFLEILGICKHCKDLI